jgi:hypothetical protein
LTSLRKFESKDLVEASGLLSTKAEQRFAYVYLFATRSTGGRERR